MADGLSHLAIAWAGGRAFDARVRAVLIIGTLLPDILYKTGLYMLQGSTWFCEASHAPLVMLVAAYAGALLFEESFRRRAFLALWIGTWLHLLIDAGKTYAGEGVIMWAFPFSMDRFEFGWYEPNETVYLILPALALAGIVELGLRAVKARR